MQDVAEDLVDDRTQIGVGEVEGDVAIFRGGGAGGQGCRHGRGVAGAGAGRGDAAGDGPAEAGRWCRWDGHEAAAGQHGHRQLRGMGLGGTGAKQEQAEQGQTGVMHQKFFSAMAVGGLLGRGRRSAGAR